MKETGVPAHRKEELEALAGAPELSPVQVARILRVHPVTVYRWLRGGKLTGRKAGRRWWVAPLEVKRFAEESGRSVTIKAQLRLRIRALKELDRFHSLLFEDVQRSGDALDLAREGLPTVETIPEGIQLLLEVRFWNRTFIRSFFAWVEGLLFALRQAVLDLHANGGVDLSEEELEKILEAGRHLKLKAAMKLSTQLFARAFAATYEANLGDDGWAAFRTAIRARDSAMHPKSASDLTMAPETVDAVRTAVRWFMEEVTALMKACAAANQPVVKYQR